ncbi:hypothetical protein [Mumia sp. DW29H23]|uniref:hypothetical protein n=1 Tax=Mumia sp. DW29H23 TaxID=3421241 RepID=UPI003D686933
MRTRTTTAGLALALGGILVATGSAAATGAAARHGDEVGTVDAVASSQPTGAHPTDSDEVVKYRWKDSRRLKADAVATSSAVCDGCSGDAVTLEVVYGWRTRSATADNVASAWSSCGMSCGASALSVQLVVLPRGRTIEANNRALALNAACTECRSVAAAYQVVVAERGAKPLSRAERRELEALVAQLHDQMQTATSAERFGRRAAKRQAARVTRAGLEDLAAFAVDATGGSIERKDADVRVR